MAGVYPLTIDGPSTRDYLLDIVPASRRPPAAGLSATSRLALDSGS
jgi:hypothetical protein